ncbi:MAG TPA: hypothetical protein VF474_05505 [Phenylobacterium sp.]
MTQTSGDEPPRRGMTPAGWTAVSAIAVALIGALVTLTTTWWQRPAPTLRPASSSAAAVVAPADKPVSQASATALPLPDPAGWVGAWSGSAQEPGGARFRIELQIAPGCAPGKACGTISVPHVPCKGRITLAEVRPEGVEFSVDRFEAGSAAACQPGAGEVFKETPEGALAYVATYSNARGVLTRVD